MKSVGEAMSIGRTFQETIQKAIRAMDDSFAGFAKNDFIEDINTELLNPTNKRLLLSPPPSIFKMEKRL
ncbi:dihydroorotate dehydrogenase [Tricholoma furcatifolium]|nr:dihydroorotate dehydrogenase [Tricholoma furcatifolium]